MSVTIALVPMSLLATCIGSMIGIGVAGVRAQNAMKNNARLQAMKMDKLHLEVDELNNILNKEFDTAIMDKQTLLKTIEEHGVVDIIQDGENISCEYEGFNIEFSRENSQEPYKIKISYVNEQNLDGFIENIAVEYGANAQEISYNKIKERLEQHNLSISQEEVFEDNSIVLTVNLD